MKKVISMLLAVFIIFAGAMTAAGEKLVTPEELGQIKKAADIDQSLTITAKSAILTERSTGTVLFEHDADKQMPPASITKVMTLLLVFEAMDAGKFTMETEIVASEHACSMGGSQIWLEPGEAFTVNELLKAAAISSANDACVALGEAVSGSEETFVELMNERAAELGMKNTVFKNCTGLDAEGHLSTARDIAIMSAELLRHPEIKNYSTVWMDSLRGGKTELTNTNRLVRFYKGCTGLKTGSTDGAGCCLSASAERDGMELISVTLGSPNTDERFAAGRKLLDYGFANWKLTTPELPELPELPVTGGMVNAVSLEGEAPRGVLTSSGGAEVGIKLILPENVPAPVEPGDVLGTAEVTLNGDTVQSLKITAKTEAPAITFFSALQYFLACFFAAEAA